MPRWTGPDEGPGIRFVEGDLFSTEDPAIAHGVNMRGLMGAGIAKTFREKFPEMYGAYKALCEHDAVSDMIFIPWRVKSGQYVMNIFSQVEPGANADIDLIGYGLEQSVQFLQDRGISRMSIPWIGAGIGGLSDQDVEDEFRSVMYDVSEPFTLTVLDKVN